jgi:recombination protein RecR
METINSLTDLFRKFPGIGPRQARRFVYYLLTADQNVLDQMGDKIKSLKKDIKQCAHCGRFFTSGYQTKADRCKICASDERDKSSLMIVEKDIDLDAIEKAKIYQGYYFVLGGNVPILDPQPENHIRFSSLLAELERRLKEGLVEVIIALSATTEGDHTTDWLVEKLRPLTNPSTNSGQANPIIKISLLGRGLSTGSELEYADPETIKNALTNRH